MCVKRIFLRFDAIAETGGETASAVAPLVGLLVLLGGGSSKTESGSNRGAAFSWTRKCL